MSFPTFKGKVVKRGDKDYEDVCYQYASSSYMKQGTMRPAAIIQPADDSDVITAIKYARDNNLAIAVRTGGHQYSGASSTTGNNIQLDLNKTYRNVTWHDDGRTVTTGISFALHEFNANLKAKGRFVPHGQCHYVNLGGHMQTGGYGQLARSFGLLGDTIQKFRIITADGEPRWVARNEEKDKDLFFGVLGGSPGNFGVITDVTIRTFRDEDHPDSRGFRAVYPYSRHTFKRLMEAMVEMAEDDNFPGDFDYCVSVMSESAIDWIVGALHLSKNYDSEHCPPGDTLVKWPPVIVVFVQWANLKGHGQKYDPSFVEKIHKAGGVGIVVTSDKKHIPMSVLTGHWVIEIRREFNLPYIKRTYASNSTGQRLKQMEWAEWVSHRIDKLRPELIDGCVLSAQFQHFGGVNSAMYKNGKNSPTAYSWRDTRLGCTMDVFYHHLGHNRAKKWQAANDEGVGSPTSQFCEEDHRLLWGSHDLDLSATHKFYFDEHPKGKYQRLCDIKKKYDPKGVFTPNRFCVGLPVDAEAKAAPEETHGLFSSLPSIHIAALDTAKEKIAEMKQAVKKKHEEEPQPSAEEKFWNVANMKRIKGGEFPMWDLWKVDEH